jgi:hypothetical protein
MRSGIFFFISNILILNLLDDLRERLLRDKGFTLPEQNGWMSGQNLSQPKILVKRSLGLNFLDEVDDFSRNTFVNKMI